MAEKRVVIENVKSEVDSVDFPIKRGIGEKIEVTAISLPTVMMSSLRRFSSGSRRAWMENCPMKLLANDRWKGEWAAEEVGCYQYTVEDG